MALMEWNMKRKDQKYTVARALFNMLSSTLFQSGFWIKIYIVIPLSVTRKIFLKKCNW